MQNSIGMGEKKMSENPMISVVMSVYNAEKYLDEAIESILNQTYKDFEFIIINDGSKDDSLKTIRKYEQQDNRIIVISRENRGLIFSLNEGIEISSGKYIARMDADDISLPTRFEKQLQFMEKDNLDICGSHYYVINQTNKYLSTRIVSSNLEFNKIVLVRSVPFAHGSVMFRKAFLIDNSLFYGSTQYDKAEDYALWIKFSKHGAKISNVDDFLFKYRHLNDSLSKQKINYQHALSLSKKYFNENYFELLQTFELYKNKIDLLNDFEKEQLSYFLLKVIFKRKSIKEMKFIKKLPINFNIINFIRILFGK